MTDNTQPDALKLAYFADSADLAGYPTAKKANAYYLCLLEDCAQMIRRLHAENKALRSGYAAAQGDALDAEVLRDAERYRFIRDVPYSDDVRSVLVHQQNAAMDRVIDAARAAQEGKSHD